MAGGPRWLVPFALAVYGFWAVLLIAQNPGVQYDEALLVSGAVHMLNSSAELTLPHDPDTWACVLGRCFPLMTVRYVGPVKEYLCLPLFRIFGTHAVIIRCVATLLAMFGIWGIARLIAAQVGQVAAGAVAMILAINPTYLDFDVFDNNAIALMMASLGLLCLAVSLYLRKPTARTAFCVGAAMAFGIWARANYVLLLVAVGLAVIIVLRMKLLQVPVSHWAAMFVGGLLAGAPFLAYQIISRGGTWQGAGMFVSHSSLRDRLIGRMVYLSELLLSDREHRAMWAGPPMPAWQLWFFPTLVFAACAGILAIRGRDVWAKITALTFLILTVILFFSRLELSEHHLVVLLPIAAVATTLASVIVAGHYRWGAIAVAIIATIYGLSALYCDVSAVQGLAKTGGVGVWSDAVYSLAADLRNRYATKDIQILDWGLQYNLYFLTRGKLRSREVWPNASIEYSESHQPWPQEIRKDGVFLLNGPENRQFPDASTGFLKALADTGLPVRRHSYRQRNNTVYAELVEIDTRLDQSDGLYPVEENGWRWTRREFSIVLTALSAAHSARLQLQLYIPDTLIRKLGPIQLRADVNGAALPPETYREAGAHEFERDLPPTILKPGDNRVHFSLDKYLQPSAADRRELGIVFKSAALQ